MMPLWPVSVRSSSPVSPWRAASFGLVMNAFFLRLKKKRLCLLHSNHQHHLFDHLVPSQ
jgi:hypothetical protein